MGPTLSQSQAARQCVGLQFLLTLLLLWEEKERAWFCDRENFAALSLSSRPLLQREARNWISSAAFSHGCVPRPSQAHGLTDHLLALMTVDRVNISEVIRSACG